MQIRNLRPVEVEIVDGPLVDAGGTVEVDDDLAARLLDQPDNWARVDSGDPTVDEVLADVADDPDRARQALAVESQRDKPRKTLVSRLEEIAATDEEQI